MTGLRAGLKTWIWHNRGTTGIDKAEIYCLKFTKLKSSFKQVGFAEFKVYNEARNLV